VVPDKFCSDGDETMECGAVAASKLASSDKPPGLVSSVTCFSNAYSGLGVLFSRRSLSSSSHLVGISPCRSP
jgi:hypothetical protein